MQETKSTGVGSRRWAILAGIGAVVLLAVILVPWLILSGAFRREAQVEIFAENRYQETLHVVTDIDYEPFSYLDKNGDYAGLDVELIAEIANRLEMNLDFELLDWSSIQERFLRGEADAILNMETDSVAADPRMIATIPTVEKQYVVYGRRQITSVAEHYDERVASLHRMPELGPDDSIRYLDSYQALFNALRDGECDYVICPIQVGNVFLQKLSIRDVRSSYAVGHIYGAIALAPENAALRDRINEVIQDLQREGFLDALDRKWISSRYLIVLINGILEMSRIESGRLELENAETDLAETLDAVRDMYDKQMKDKRLSYSVTAEQLTDRRVLCDQARLIRVTTKIGQTGNAGLQSRVAALRNAFWRFAIRS